MDDWLRWKILLNRIQGIIATSVRITQSSAILLQGVVVGIAGGFVSVGFRNLIRFFGQITMRGNGGVLELVPQLPSYWKILLPVVGGMLVGPLVYFVAREAKGHGVPEVMRAIALKNGIIRPRVAVVKSIASGITISSGGSVGEEGPIIQVGAAVGSTIGQIMRVSPERLQILVGCGAAAGLAATFNVPIAGAFFALEVILGNFTIASFSPIVIAAVMATVISRAFLGNMPIFIVPHYSLVTSWEIVFYGVLGVISAGVAVLFINSVYVSERLFENLHLPDYIKPAIGGLGVGLIILYYPQVFGGGYEAIENAIRGEMLWPVLLALIFAKLIATSITLGSGGSGGVFAPSLFLGAVAGGSFGYLVHWLFPSITATSGAYAMVGMGAVVAGATHAPITAILILFEMTNDYKIILPLMVACTLATVLARRLKSDSIYTLKLSLDGIAFNRGREEIIMKSFRVRELLNPKAPIIEQASSFENIVQMFMNSDEPYLYVVNHQGQLLGTLMTHHIKSVLDASKTLQRLIIARDLMQPVNAVVTPTSTLAECMALFERVESEHLPVVDDPATRRLIGTISKKDIIKLYNREILKKELLSAKYVRPLETEDHRYHIRLPLNYQIDLVAIPDHWIGKSMRDLNIRAKYRVTVLAVKRSTIEPSSADQLPDPDYVLQCDDVLVVAGKRATVERFRKATIRRGSER